MLTLLKNADVYCPAGIGRSDLLLCAGTILAVAPAGGIPASPLIDSVIDCTGRMAFPGLIDQHVHITGGGGEEGFASRIPELSVREILMAGVTTVGGLLGADGSTRSLENLYAKAKALELAGVSSFIYSGSYAVPAATFTGSITRDLVLIDKVLGAGEIAISDHRSSQPTRQILAKLAADTHLGGLLSGKAGVLHLHVGDGKAGLNPLFELVEKSDLPLSMFVPTHQNRSPALLSQAAEYCKKGGNIDLTAGETAGIPVPKAIRMLLSEGIGPARVTVSSDANGSIPGGGAGKIGVLYDDLRKTIIEEHLPPELVFGLFTTNVAKVLKLFPRKGVLRAGSDADILITDKNFNAEKLFCKGRLLLDGGRILTDDGSDSGREEKNG